MDSDCPYPDLKACLHVAFRSLTETYQKRLQTLQQQLGKTDRYVGQLEVQLCFLLISLKTCIGGNKPLWFFFHVQYRQNSGWADINDRLKTQIKNSAGHQCCIEALSIPAAETSICACQACLTMRLINDSNPIIITFYLYSQHAALWADYNLFKGYLVWIWIKWNNWGQSNMWYYYLFQGYVCMVGFNNK